MLLRLTLAALALVPALMAVEAGAPRVAVWNPEKGTKESRFQIDLAAYDKAAEWLRAAGIEVSRAIAGDLNDPAKFSAARFDALMMRGDTFPRAATKSLQKFADDGGILVALAGMSPFLIAIEKESDGSWTYAPKTPTFAWQSSDIYGWFGLKYIYNPGLHDQGTLHTPTALLKRYLPDAPEIRRKLPSRWFVPTGGGEIYPLLRSLRPDGKDTAPQVYIARSGSRMAIISASDIFTASEPSAEWPGGAKTVAALTRLAKDLRDGKVKLDPSLKIDLPENMAPPAPLTARPAGAGIEPEHARPVVRWGRFNGSAVEFGEPLGEKKSLDLAAGAPDKDFPRALGPGAAVRLAVPALGAGPKYLRIRGAFSATGAGLTVRLGDAVVLSEIYNHVNAGGPGNYDAPDLRDVAAEFTRILYLPPAAAGATTLTLTNCGTQPVFFDAIQIEERAAPGPEMIIGLNQGFGWSYPGKKNPIPAEISARWGPLRAGIRSQFVGPPEDPQRWAKIDEHIAKYLAIGVPLQLLFEGTPAWAAVSPERYRNSAGRPHTVPPDPEKYAAIVEEVVRKYGDRIDAYEIWNEANIQQFWRGSQQEYIKLFMTVARVIRRLDPTARIIAGGMAGTNEAFVRAMIDSGAVAASDLIGYHPYAGKGPGWDIPYGQIQGLLMSECIDKEIFCNESGFVWKNSEWFQPPPSLPPELQRDMLSRAMARVLANGLVKLSVFHAGGDDHPFGLIDQNGVPRPAYAVFSDYLELAPRGDGRRLDVTMVPAGDEPLRGVYRAAAVHADGSATVIVNLCEAEVLRPTADPSTEFDTRDRWVTFFGKSDCAGGKVTLVPDPDKGYVGFYTIISLDADRLPLIEASAPEAEKPWMLLLKTTDGKTVLATVAEGQGAGVFRANYRALLKTGGPQELQLSIRAAGKTVFDYIRFLPADDKPAPKPKIAVRLLVPLARPGPVTAKMHTGDAETPVAVKVNESGGQAWADMTVAITGRSVITIK